MTAIKRQIVDGILFGADREVAEWVHRRCDDDGVPVGGVGLGMVDRSGNLIAGMFTSRYHTHSGLRDYECTIAVDRFEPFLGQQLRRGFSHLFDVMNAERLLAMVSSDNTRCWKLIEYFGFQYVGIVRSPPGMSPVWIYALARENCRFLPGGRR